MNPLSGSPLGPDGQPLPANNGAAIAAQAAPRISRAGRTAVADPVPSRAAAPAAAAEAKAPLEASTDSDLDDDRVRKPDSLRGAIVCAECSKAEVVSETCRNRDHTSACRQFRPTDVAAERNY